MQNTHSLHISQLENKLSELNAKQANFQKQVNQGAHEYAVAQEEISAYKNNIQILERRVVELSDAARNLPELRSQTLSLQTRIKELEEMKPNDGSDDKNHQVDDFLESNDGIRDRVISTLKQQLILREREISFHRDERNRGLEHHKKTEKLLVSAIHSIALRYHEEMVARYDSQESPMHNPADDSSQADSMYGT